MNVHVFGTRGFPNVQGGVEKHCEHLYPRIAEKFHVTVYRRKPYICSNQTYKNITFIDFPSTKIKGFEALFHSFLATMNVLTKRTDIVHIHNIGPAFFSPILHLFRKKIVLTYHSANYEHKKWNFIERKILKMCERISFKYADAIIFVNKFQMDKVDNSIKEKSYYIPNGIDTPVSTTGTDFLCKWNIQPQKYILAVGRITPEKGFDILIKAFLSANTDNQLVIAGGIEYESGYYKKLIQTTDKEKIIFTGAVYGDELNQLYANARLFVLPSLSEGFPIVLLEAMSYNLPVIASDIPATHLVNLEPECYYPCGNIKILAEKITEETKIPYSSKSYPLQEYDWNKIANQTIDIYKYCCQAKLKRR